MNKIIFIFIVFMTATLFAETALKKDDHVLFKNPETGKDEIAIVNREIDTDSVEIKFQVFLEKTNHFQKVTLKKNEIIRPISELGQLKSDMKVCFLRDVSGMKRGDSAVLETLFENGKAEVSVGDFFGFRFLMFVRPELVNQSDIGPCPCRDCGE